MQVDDQPTVDSFLHSLGLDKYSINFKAEEVSVKLSFVWMLEEVVFCCCMPWNPFSGFFLLLVCLEVEKSIGVFCVSCLAAELF